MHAQAHDLPASNGRSSNFASHHRWPPGAPSSSSTSSSMLANEEERQWQALAQAIMKIKQADCPFTPNLSARNPSPEAAQRLRSQALAQLGVQLDAGWLYFPGVRAPPAEGPKYDPCITHPALQPPGYFRSSVSVLRFLQLLQQQGAELPGVVAGSSTSSSNSSSNGAAAAAAGAGGRLDPKRQAAAVAAALQVIGKSFVQPRVASAGGGRGRGGWGARSRQVSHSHHQFQHARSAPAAAQAAAAPAAAAAAAAAVAVAIAAAADEEPPCQPAFAQQQQQQQQQEEEEEEQLEHGPLQGQHEPLQQPDPPAAHGANAGHSLLGETQQQREQQGAAPQLDSFGTKQQAVGHKRCSPAAACAEQQQEAHDGCGAEGSWSPPAGPGAEGEGGQQPLLKRHNAGSAAGLAVS